MTGPNILITGGSGFIGTNLLEFYLHKGFNVLNIDVIPPRNKAHLRYWKQVDILNYEQLSFCVSQFQPNYIFHLAARTDLDGTTISDYSPNIQGVANLLRSIQPLYSLKRILFSSSRLVCKIGYMPRSFDDYCPPNLYGHSKVAGELLVKEFTHNPRYDWLIFRPTSIWGEWFDIPYKQFFDHVISGRYVHPHSQSIFKSFGYVGNSVYQLDSLSTAAHNVIHNRTFYLADYPPIEVFDMANRIRSSLGLSPVHQVPRIILHLLAKLGDFSKLAGFKRPPLTSFRLNNLFTQMVYNTDDLKSIVGPLPYTLDQGIASTLDWIKSNNNDSL